MPKLGKNRTPGLTKKVQQCVELLVWGIPGGDSAPDAAAVAAHMGISEASVKRYLRQPAAIAFQKEETRSLRAAEEPRSIRTAIKIRDDSAGRDEAAHRKVAIEAARYIEGRADGGVTIHNNIAVGVANTPGFQVVIPGAYMKDAERLLAASGSTKALGRDGEVYDPRRNILREAPPSDE
jgi:hypothetical protein